MNVQKYGWAYIKSYSGVLSIAEQVLNISTFISGSTCGYVQKTLPINFASIYAIIATGFFMATHVTTTTCFRKTENSLAWYECANALALVIIYVISASIVISELSAGFIVTGVLGYIAVMVCILDTVDKYHVAATPRARYVWTTPHMLE